MKTFKQYSNLAVFSMLFMLTIFAAGCGSSGDNAADTTAPTIISTNPGDTATGIFLNRSITAFSDEALDASTVTASTFTLTASTGTVAGDVSYENKAVVFNPSTDLNASVKYTATLTTGVKDSAGNAMASDYVWSFTTGTNTDNTPPSVTSTYPVPDATDVPYNKSISALFDEALDPTTVTSVTFSLETTIGSTAVAGTVSYTSDTMIFDPTSDLAAGIEYTATITTGVTDLAGNALAVQKVWSFTTGTAAAPVLAPVNLGTAGNYVILAKTAVSATTTAGTAITGNIGVSPAARTYITGFSDTLSADGTYSTSSLVTGRIYAANMTSPTPSNLTTAVSNMETAYTDAAGRKLPDFTNLHAGIIDGHTLTPGLYKWGTDVSITNSVTILGSATDVWIFQIAGNLTVANGATVTLAGGALAKNIFWQVAGGTGVTLETTADFKGVVLAQKGIIVKTNATVNGRLLAQTAVTLDANAVTQPAN